MQGKWIKLITAAVVACLGIGHNNSLAAVLHLKGGQKIEGEYLGGTKSEVNVKVGSQTLKFKVAEVVAVIFDSGSYTQPATSGQDDFSTAAKAALRSLKALDSVAEGGVTYNDYGPRVSDTKIKVNEFLDEYGQSQMLPDFIEHLSVAMAYYVEASTAWSAKMTKSYKQVPPDSYVYKCGKWARVSSKNEFYQIVGLDIPSLWACAKAEILTAEAILKIKK